MAEITELQVTYQQGVINGNFDDVKASLKATLADYQNVVYTEDTVKDAKKDVATLRKIKKAIEDKRKEIKKTWNDPYTTFENLTKELISLIDEPINQINAQLEEFEQQRQEEKRTKIDEEYNKRFSTELMEYMSLESIFDDKWLNASTSMKSIKDALDAKKTFLESSIKTIRSCGAETEEKALKMFKETLNLQDTLAWINQYRLQKEDILKKQREEEQERQRKEEEERIRKEEQDRLNKEEEERKAKEANERMVSEMLQEKEPEPQQQGFDIPPENKTENSGFDNKIGCFDTENSGFSAENHGFGTENRGFDSVPVPQEQQGFEPQPEQQGVSSGGFEPLPKKNVVFTVRVPDEMANHFEELIKQWGYTDFDRR